MFSSIQEAWGESFNDPKPLFDVKEEFSNHICQSCKKNIETFIPINNPISIDNFELKNAFLLGVLVIIILYFINKN